MKKICLTFCVLTLPWLAAGQTSSEVSTEPTIPTLPDVNPELLRVVIADQWDRGMDMFGGRPAKSATPADWNAIAARDKERQATVRALVANGQLTSARDYQFAALVFQHSDLEGDVRLAHVLAVTAALKGQPTAKWLAAAALDRSLWATHQPQIFGTQFKQSSSGAGGWTMDPYDRAALPDSVRAEWCVVSLHEQADVLTAFNSGQSGSTTTRDCK